MAEGDKPPTYQELVQANTALRADNAGLKSKGRRLEAEGRQRGIELDQLRRGRRATRAKLDPKSPDPFRRPWTGR